MDGGHLTSLHGTGQSSFGDLLVLVARRADIINLARILPGEVHTRKVLSVGSVKDDTVAADTDILVGTDLVHGDPRLDFPSFSVISSDVGAHADKISCIVGTKGQSCHAVNCVELLSMLEIIVVSEGQVSFTVFTIEVGLLLDAGACDFSGSVNQGHDG